MPAGEATSKDIVAKDALAKNSGRRSVLNMGISLLRDAGVSCVTRFEPISVWPGEKRGTCATSIGV
jgi:hypothetical protein